MIYLTRFLSLTLLVVLSANAQALITQNSPSSVTQLSDAAAAADARTAQEEAHRARVAANEAQSAIKEVEKAASAAKESNEKAKDAADKAVAAAEKIDKAADRIEKATDKPAPAPVVAVPPPAPVAAPTTTTVNVETKNEPQIITVIKVPSNRQSHLIGVYASLWGDPFPTTLGFNLAYNASDWVRLNAGIGSDDTEKYKISTVGTGAKFLVPGWTFTPVLGVNLSLTSGKNGPRAVKGFDPSGSHLYVNFGFDWQTGLGLDFQVGHIVNLQSGPTGSYYLNAGIFL